MIEVLKQALEALESMANEGWLLCGPEGMDVAQTKCVKAITSLRQAIAKAEDNYQGSDAAKAAHMMDLYTALGVRWGDNPFAVIAKMRSIAELESQESNPIKDGWKLSVANGHSGYGVYAHMEEYPEEGAFLLLSIKELESQEPVAVWELFEDGWDSIADPEWMESLPIGTKLYTHPPQRKPLTDEDLIECERLADIRHRKHMGSIRGQQLSSADQFLWHYARAIEAKLKERNL